MPQFSPDSKTIAFISDREDKEKPAQIHLIPVNGGEAHKLTDIQGEIRSFKWSPDGKTLLLTVRKFDPDELERLKDEQKKKLGVVCRSYVRVFTNLMATATCPRSASISGRWMSEQARQSSSPITRSTTRPNPITHRMGSGSCLSPTAARSPI